MNFTIRFGLSIILIVIIFCTQIPQTIGVQSGIVIQPPNADTWVNSMYLHTKYPEKPHGYLWALFAGNMHYKLEDVFGSSRIYLKFNLSAITSEYQIVSAILKLYMYDGPSSQHRFDIHIVNGDWNENLLIWATQPDFDETPIDSTNIDSTANRWISWNVTKAMEGWHLGKYDDHGLMIKINKEMNVSDEIVSFYPKENVAGEEFAPKLEIIVEGDTEIPEIPLYTFPMFLACVIFFAYRSFRKIEKIIP
ncbi:MAG: DNRLRE domain-containing protein [Candidatus Bathyarchaeota archaeon]|nr:DNRLRE domain-containing protein [Candidatus Bathyarchaeota archaeon]